MARSRKKQKSLFYVEKIIKLDKNGKFISE